ncbi:MAG: hypothetical protein F6K28_13470 [Microcoleus sp. SIO2G3]|nr:hypothetical protein [Microcoleus sp. SIO2G3]
MKVHSNYTYPSLDFCGFASRQLQRFKHGKTIAKPHQPIAHMALVLLTCLSTGLALSACQTSASNSSPNSSATSQANSTPQQNPAEAVAREFISTISRGQQAYQLENGNFTSKIEDLEVEETKSKDSYEYQISLLDETRAQVTATAKKPGLKSYTAGIFVIGQKGNELTIRILCRTDKPSQTPPKMPTLPQGPVKHPQCPAGSSEVS